jgi:hypothetical protein
MARLAADLPGSLLAETGARRHAEPRDLCPTTPQPNYPPRRPLLAEMSALRGSMIMRLRRSTGRVLRQPTDMQLPDHVADIQDRDRRIPAIMPMMYQLPCYRVNVAAPGWT